MSNHPLDFPEVHCLIDGGATNKPTKSLSLDNFPTNKNPSEKHRFSCQQAALPGFPSRRCSNQSRRKSSSGTRRKSRKISREDKAIEERRKRTVCIVVGIFLFILFSCVLVVIVTLTHQSEYAKMNTTHSYYTFAPPAVHPGVSVATATTIRPKLSSEGERRIDELHRPGPQ